jgi:hypothetical protein
MVNKEYKRSEMNSMKSGLDQRFNTTRMKSDFEKKDSGLKWGIEGSMGEVQSVQRWCTKIV